AHGAFPAYTIAGDAVEPAVDLLVSRNRGAAARGEPLDRLKAFRLLAVVLERVELHCEHPRRRLEQQWQIDVIGTEAHAVFAQTRAGGLIEALHVLCNLLALEHAEPFGKLERDATRNASDVLGGGKLEQRT